MSPSATHGAATFEGVRSQAQAATRRLTVINGRFLEQRLTGVQRYAWEMVRALDALLADQARLGNHWPVELHAPPGARELPGLRHIRLRTTGIHTGHAWEQMDLPRSAWGALLIGFGNTGPLAHRRQIVTLHDAGIYAVPEAYSRTFRSWYRLLYAVLGRRALKVLTVSRFSAMELSLYTGLRRSKFAVVPNAADHFLTLTPAPDALQRFDLQPGTYVFAIGSAARHKNLAMLAEALSHVPAPALQLVTVGHRDARMFGKVATVEGAGVRELGAVSDADLKALYQNALCLVFPSTYEGFGLPPLEAMAAGCPVIVSQAASLPEVCGEAALYCDPASPQDIAAKIARLRSDPDLRDELIRLGRERVGQFGWERNAERLLQVLEEVSGR
jgi:glycosyltransferase involved in cell wall biosynthesis